MFASARKATPEDATARSPSYFWAMGLRGNFSSIIAVL